MARAILLLAPFLVSACGDVDRGECLSGHTAPAWMQPLPIRVGNVTIISFIRHPAHLTCDEWEYHDGRQTHTPEKQS